MYIRHHVNYHSSMIYDGLTGIVKLDKKVKFYLIIEPDKVEGSTSLHHVSYNHIKLSGGHSLIGNAHQENQMSNVDIVTPNTPKADTMVAMMNIAYSLLV